MFEFAVEIQAAKTVPSVISMSYAWSEYDQCGDTTGANCTGLGVNATGYVQRTNAEFAKVGLMGITMLGASGDSGCHGRTDSDCFFNPYMFPPYPASSPYITTVGGTQLVNGINTGAKSPICQPGQPLNGNCATGGSEIVSSTETGSQIVSGGGFALYSPMPNWQAKFVLAYLNNQTVVNFANASYFNMQGRGFPDVSALAHNFFIESGGAAGTVDGTSAATPSFAGMVALINAHRNAKGRPAVGFLNPLLYQVFANTNGAAYNDITVGSNRCTEDGCSCTNGFLATPGWDAATGLGTPNFGVLINALDAMDEAREALIRQQKQQ
jgi:tripeptidyl-peptidase-1